jgi:general secretion pathway protein C
MSQVADLLKFNPITLQRLLRQEIVGWVVKAIQWGCLGVGLVAIAAITWEAIGGTLKTKRVIAALESGVRALSDFGAPTETRRDKSASYNLIVERNIFGPMTMISAPAGPTPPPPKPKATTPLTLVGTFVAAGETPHAIIEDQKKKIQDVFEVDALVFGEAKVVAIMADRVELDRDGQRETLLLDDMLSPGAPERDSGGGSSDEIVVDESELDRALENLPLLLTQARAVPYFADGQAVGLRLFAIKTGSLYEKIGLRNGDVLKSVNGNSLADLSQAMQLFERLKTERSISLTVERNREQKEFKYQIR